MNNHKKGPNDLYNIIKHIPLPFEISEYDKEIYYKFLCLKVFTNDINGTILSPTIDLDRIWHKHLLYNKHYLDICNKLDFIIYHYPENSSHSDKQKKNRIENLKYQLYTYFNIQLNDIVDNNLIHYDSY